MSVRKNPMKEELTERERLMFALEILASNLVAGGLKKEKICFVSTVFKNKLLNCFERIDYNQTS